jgi:hypothetical protein
MNIKKWIIFLVIIVSALLGSQVVMAETLKAPEVFQDGKWTYIGETGKFEEKGSIQSICVTKDYIICLENASNDTADNDTLVAFYKNDYDLSGNPVEQYSYALHVNYMDYEHGNGMTYNEKEDKVIIASGPVLDKANLGTVYILDARTLKFERQVEVTSNGQSILGIDYMMETDQYVMMTGFEGNYRFILTDSEFRILDTIMEGNQSEGNYFQDFCVSGDYLIGLPYFVGGRKEQRIQLYSLSQRQWIDNYPLIFAEDMTSMEPEGICEVAPGHFMVGTILRNPKRIGLYALQVPLIYNIETSIENGVISQGTTTAEYGSKFKVEYTPDAGYEVKEIWIDKEAVEVKRYINKYTFDDIDADRAIRVVCEKTPQYHIKGKVLNGSIDEETLVYENNKVRVNFAPNEHFRLKGIFVDGQRVESALDATYIEFDQIQADHDVYVEFEPIPKCQITINITNGYTGEIAATVYQGDSYQTNFSPRVGYTLSRILVDGTAVTHEQGASSYQLTNVEGNHLIEVVYQWRYLKVLIITGVVFMAAGILLVIWHLRSVRKRRMKITTKDYDS